MTVVRSKAGETPSKKTKIVSIKDKQHLEKLKPGIRELQKEQLALGRKWDKIEKSEERIKKLKEAFKTIKASETLKSVIKVLGIVFAIWCILEVASRVRFNPAAKELENFNYLR
jgi:succinate dehydrogenase/fumarate reductase flavoprotein subunit